MTSSRCCLLLTTFARGQSQSFPFYHVMCPYISRDVSNFTFLNFNHRLKLYKTYNNQQRYYSTVTSMTNYQLRQITSGHIELPKTTLDHHGWLRDQKKQSDASCPLCEDEQETSLHFLARCSATMARRMQYFERPFLSPCELRQEHWISLLRFAKNLDEILMTFRSNMGLRIGPTGGLSIWR